MNPLTLPPAWILESKHLVRPREGFPACSRFFTKGRGHFSLAIWETHAWPLARNGEGVPAQYYIYSFVFRVFRRFLLCRQHHLLNSFKNSLGKQPQRKRAEDNTSFSLCCEMNSFLFPLSISCFNYEVGDFACLRTPWTTNNVTASLQFCKISMRLQVMIKD